MKAQTYIWFRNKNSITPAFSGAFAHDSALSLWLHRITMRSSLRLVPYAKSHAIRSAVIQFLFLNLLFYTHVSFSTETKVYRYIDDAGVLHLSTKPPVEASPLATPTTPSTVLHLHNQGGQAQISHRPYQSVKPSPHQVDQALLRAIIEVESNWNPAAISPKGATGLMQLMPSTAAQYGTKNLQDPLENLQAGVKHLNYLMKKFAGNLSLVLAAYNAGEGAVMKYGGKIPPYPETQAYVKKVLELYGRYQLQ